MVTRIALAVLLAVAVGFAWSRHQGRKHDESRWAQIASSVVGHPVAVHCPNAFERLTSVSSEAGYVRFTAAGPPEAQTFLAPATCDGLARFAKGHKVTFENAWAVQTLAHESFHMRGVMEIGSQKPFSSSVAGSTLNQNDTVPLQFAAAYATFFAASK